jgi:DNA-binding NtrC family response regulator
MGDPIPSQAAPPPSPTLAPSPPPSLLIVDADVGFVHAAAEAARQQGFEITIAAELQQGLERVRQHDYDLALVDVDLPDGSGLALLDDVDAKRTQTIVVSGAPTIDSALRSLRGSVTDYLVKPIEPLQLHQALQRCLQRRRHRPLAVARRHGMVGASPAFHRLVHLLQRVAPTDAAVLLHGESGSGKELVAHAIHDASGRAGPFVAVNCGAVAPELLASQLFGHEKGSFTGAVGRHRGFLEQAAGGTLFLDEITEMPAQLQTHLLRVLDHGSYRRVGGDRELPVDVRIVSATNREPAQAVASGRLREDLYYRLCAFDIAVPPLRERGEDAMRIADACLAELNARHGTAHAFAAWAPDVLRAHPWPGNVRELRNVVLRAYVLAEDGLLQPRPDPPRCATIAESDSTVTFAVGASLEEIEREVLRKTLQHFGNNRRRAAAALGITTRTIRNRLARERERPAG